jgi:hypothetical protein
MCEPLFFDTQYGEKQTTAKYPVKTG